MVVDRDTFWRWVRVSWLSNVFRQRRSSWLRTYDPNEDLKKSLAPIVFTFSLMTSKILKNIGFWFMKILSLRQNVKNRSVSPGCASDQPLPWTRHEGTSGETAGARIAGGWNWKKQTTIQYNSNIFKILNKWHLPVAPSKSPHISIDFSISVSILKTVLQMGQWWIRFQYVVPMTCMIEDLECAEVSLFGDDVENKALPFSSPSFVRKLE